MLTALSIKQFAIVKELDLDFTQGMSAFTGETGAGKSIMIDALMLALGGRADVSVIRPGHNQCDITACFYMSPDSEPAQWLAEHDLSYAEGEVYLRRVIATEGRSKSYINGHPFPLQKVKELSEKLVHIHGQHQHQTLMHHATHRQQLDQYAKNQKHLETVSQLYHRYQKVQQRINALHNSESQQDRLALLQFQIEELTALNLQEGEVARLSQEHQLLHHAQDYLHHGQQIDQLLNGEEGPNVTSFLHQIFQLLNFLPAEHQQIKNINELMNNALIQCEEAAGELQRFMQHVPLDEIRLQEVEARMSVIHQLARKHQIEASQLYYRLLSLEVEQKALKNSDDQLAILQQEQQQLKREYEQAAFSLRQERQKHATLLAQEITTSIQQLGMPKGWLEIEVTPLDKMTAHGLDKIEYKVCTNPGMLPDSLNKIASGGELSRISLAIQMITARQGATPTLLFDEVDVGIGGATAALVGQMLRQLGERLQIFCVTHQPQVAAAAHHHFKVEKQIDANTTFTTITPLTLTAKVNEIARMLGGLKMTSQTQSHAQELLMQSNDRHVFEVKD